MEKIIVRILENMRIIIIGLSSCVLDAKLQPDHGGDRNWRGCQETHFKFSSAGFLREQCALQCAQWSLSSDLRD